MCWKHTELSGITATTTASDMFITSAYTGGNQRVKRLLKLGLRVPTHDERWLSHCFPMVRAVAPSWVQCYPHRGARLRKFKFKL